MKKVSGKTHTKEQLDNWANQNTPNNKAYRDTRERQPTVFVLRGVEREQFCRPLR